MSTNVMSLSREDLPRLSEIAGWRIWNYSKDFSRGNQAARVARYHTTSCQGSAYWEEKDLIMLEDLTSRLERQALQGLAGWDMICTTSNEYSSAPSRGPSGAAPDQELLQLLRDIFHTSRDEQYWTLLDEFKLVLVRGERLHLEHIEQALSSCTSSPHHTYLQDAKITITAFISAIEPHESGISYLWPVDDELEQRVLELRHDTLVANLSTT